MPKSITKSAVVLALILSFILILETPSFAMSRLLETRKPPVNNPPKILSVSPNNLTKVAAGTGLVIAVQVIDQDNEPLQYRFLANEQVFRDWSSLSSAMFNATSQNFGRYQIKIEVRDTRGAVDSKSIAIFVYMPVPNPGG